MFNSSDFTYDKNTKVMACEMSTLGLRRFPRELTVSSVHTGQVLRFVYDNDAAVRNEGWDGEMAEYVPDSSTAMVVNVKRLVLFND